jgi:hypothetical protein
MATYTWSPFGQYFYLQMSYQEAILELYENAQRQFSAASSLVA